MSKSPFKSVLIVSSRMDIRTAVRDALKAVGGINVMDSSGIQDAWRTLEAIDPPDWIISTLEAHECLNAIHLMALLLREITLKSTRISLIISPEEKNLLPAAFEMGLLSYFQTPLTKNSIVTSFEALFKGFEQNNGNNALTAARYLRDLFNEQERYQELITLEERLINRYPSIPQLFLNLAEAQYLNGQLEEAKRTLTQAKYLGADLSFAASQLESLIKSEDDDEEEELASFSVAFGVTTVCIIDPDESSVNQMKVVMEELGIATAHSFVDGKEALAWLEQNNPPDLILHEWKIPGLPGPGLLQRLRAQKCPYTPIIIVSSLVGKEDKFLIKEMGASCTVQKPFTNHELATAIMSTMRFNKYPSEAQSIETKFRQAIQSKDARSAREWFGKLRALDNYPIGSQLVHEAEVLFLENDYEKARELAVEGLKKQSDSLIALNLLGKVLLKMGDLENSYKFFSRAQEFSPKNIERLCNMAENLSEMGEKDSAGEVLTKAESIDNENPTLVEKTAELAINSGDVEAAKEIMDSMATIANVISYMNSKAIALAVQGHYKEAYTLYDDLTRSIPEGKPLEKASVLYNFALAYAREGKLRKAKGTLELIDLDSVEILRSKITSLLKKIAASLASNTPLQLNLAPKPQPVSTDTNAGMPIAWHARSGEICLHMIYQAQDLLDPAVKNYLKKIPRFGRRDPKKLEPTG